MMILLDILKTIILPLLMLMTIGYVLNRIFSFHVGTLSKLNFNFYIPVLVFTKIFETEFQMDLLFLIVLFVFLQATALYLLGYAVSLLFSFDRKLKSSFLNSVVLINAGNFGLPVNALALNHDPLGMSVHIIVLSISNFLTFSLGMINANSSDSAIKEGFLEYVKSPIFFALILGVFGNLLNVPLPPVLKDTLWSIADGFFVFALITFGAQIVFKNMNGNLFPLLGSVLLKLIISPIIAFGIIRLLDIDGVVAAALLIASALPTSRNSALIALDYDNYPEFAAQAVLFSTLLGSLVITVIIYFATIYYL